MFEYNNVFNDHGDLKSFESIKRIRKCFTVILMLNVDTIISFNEFSIGNKFWQANSNCFFTCCRNRPYSVVHKTCQAYFNIFQWSHLKSFKHVWPFLIIMHERVSHDHDYFQLKVINPLSANAAKWSNTLKQFVGKIADELFECAWPFCKIGPESVWLSNHVFF